MNPVVREKLEPYIKLAPFLGVGLVVVALAVAGIFFVQRGAHVELLGSQLRSALVDHRQHVGRQLLDAIKPRV